jgi:hypothetical protein
MTQNTPSLKPVHILATATDSVTFTVSGDAVTVTRSSSVGPWPKYPRRDVFTLAQGRALYGRLLQQGFYVW